MSQNSEPADPQLKERLAGEKTDPERGLDMEEAARRAQEGLSNEVPEDESHSLGSIIRENVFTYFNFIFLVIAILLCMVGSFRNLTFLPVIIANTLIGIFQQWRSKVTLEKLTILHAPKTTVVREGEARSIPAAELVLGDIIELGAGDQIPADAVVASGSAQVNESLLTGEEQEIGKEIGDKLFSGSFVVSGRCRARLTAVGADSYAAALTREARREDNREKSEMIRSLNLLLKVIGVLIIPVGITLFVQQYRILQIGLRASIVGTMAAIIGMIPEGLYLLTSVALAVSVMRLALGRVLVHNMKSIETLARVDVLCVDKTGTITQPGMQVTGVVPLHAPSVLAMFDGGAGDGGRTGSGMGDRAEADAASEEKPGSADTGTGQTPGSDSTGTSAQLVSADSSADVQERALLSLLIGDFAAAMSDDNDTMRAIRAAFTKGTGGSAREVYSFSPVYKYSAALIGQRPLVLGAPEFLLRAGAGSDSTGPDSTDSDSTDPDSILALAQSYAEQGLRVLLFGEYTGTLDGGALNETVVPMAFVLLQNPIRPDAKETFRYFAKQGVEIKVISGDNPAAVSYIAGQAGIEGAEKYIDASTLGSDPEILNAVGKYTVFGRVTPQQKRKMVAALKKRGHTVAMTGDGVNDVLALRDADCSAAMASGSSAAAQAAQIVLLDSEFSRMPAVVAEGRRVVNNIERTASLFLVKNIFSVLLSLFSVIFLFDYPLEPSQVSLISMFTIGIPAFVMALESNHSRIKGRFLSNVISRALPAGLTDFAVISTLVVFCRVFHVSAPETSTACTILLAIVGLMILYRIASPMTPFHWVLWALMLFGLLFCMTFLNHVFAISAVSQRCGMLLVIFAIVTEPVMRYTSLAVTKIWHLCGKLREGAALRRRREKYAKRLY